MPPFGIFYCFSVRKSPIPAFLAQKPRAFTKDVPEMNEQQNTNNTCWYQSKLFKQIMFALVDTASVLGAYLFMLSFRFGGKIPPLYFESFTGSLVFIILIHLVVNLVFHLYSSLWKHAGLTEILSVVGAGVFGTAFVYLYSLFFNSILPRSTYIASGFILILLFGFTRMFYRVMRHLFKGSYNSADAKRAIIIGAGETGSILAKQLQERPDLGVKVVGYIDDDAEKRNSYLVGHRVLGTVSELPKIVEKRSIDEIIFAIPSASSKVRKEILELCTKTGCKLKIIPGLDAMLEGVDIRRMRDVKPEDLLVRDEVRINNSDISEYLTDRVVLVTGGGGSIGSELCRQIAKFGPKKLIIFDIYENNAYELYISLRDEYGMDFPCEVVIGSVRDMKRVDEVFRQYQPEIVFHAAAHKHVPLMEVSPGEAVKNNVNGTF
ncbi:MAG: polysaccharide biosynthesis protein, partial [Clostridiales bacterium]|nr:polysaccharide biosynthesis protein [Clostridiales bacterium]